MKFGEDNFELLLPNYLTSEQAEKLINQANEVGKIIRGLIKSITPITND